MFLCYQRLPNRIAVASLRYASTDRYTHRDSHRHIDKQTDIEIVGWLTLSKRSWCSNGACACVCVCVSASACVSVCCCLFVFYEVNLLRRPLISPEGVLSSATNSSHRCLQAFICCYWSFVAILDTTTTLCLLPTGLISRLLDVGIDSLLL